MSVEGRSLAHAASRQASFPPPPGCTAPLAVQPFFARVVTARRLVIHMGEATQQSGNSGRRLAIAIVLIGILGAIAGLLFREFTPPSTPATQPAATQPTTDAF